jgi:hypothetical protein
MKFKVVETNKKLTVTAKWAMKVLLADLNNSTDEPVTAKDVRKVELIPMKEMYAPELADGEKVYLYRLTFNDGRVGAMTIKMNKKAEKEMGL